MPGSVRSYREWLARFFATVPMEGLEIDLRVQPVVLIDDQRDLALPPVLTRFAGGGTTAAVIAEDGTLILTPIGTSPVRVERARCSAAAGIIRFGVNDRREIPIPTMTAPEVWLPQAVQFPLGTVAGSPSTAQVTTGTVLAPILGTANTAQLIEPANEQWWEMHDLIVLPGQYFWMQRDTPNTGNDMFVWWSELTIDIASQQASMPRR